MNSTLILSLPLVTGAVIYLARKVYPSAWAATPAQWRWVLPLLLATGVAFGDAVSRGLPWRDALLQSIAGTLAGLSASGGHHALVDSPLPYGAPK